jgi:hypothetical protein
MRTFSVSSDGKLAITASETSSKNDFDYLTGLILLGLGQRRYFSYRI